MSHAQPLKKRKSYTWSLTAYSKSGTVLFSDSGPCADPILAHLEIMQQIKLHSTHKWNRIVSECQVIPATR